VWSRVVSASAIGVKNSREVEGFEVRLSRKFWFEGARAFVICVDRISRVRWYTEIILCMGSK